MSEQKLTERPKQHDIIVSRSDWHIKAAEIEAVPFLADLEYPCCHQIGEHLENCPGRLLTP